jgi:hypothetical protein
MALQYKRGDLMQFTETMAVQQCNCLTTTGLGLAEAFAKQLAVDPYARRTPLYRGASLAAEAARPAPGTYEVVKSNDGRQVACLYTQVAPGRASDDPRCNVYYNKHHKLADSHSDREQYFETTLRQMLTTHKPASVAMPRLIGCGLAGGDAKSHQAILEKLANEFKDQTVIVLYDMP